MVVIDKLSKVTYFVVVISISFSNEVAQIFIKKIVRLYRIPKKLVQTKIQSSLQDFGRN